MNVFKLTPFEVEDLEEGIKGNRDYYHPINNIVYNYTCPVCSNNTMRFARSGSRPLISIVEWCEQCQYTSQRPHA